MEQWVKDLIVYLPHVEQLPSANQKDAKDYPFHRKKGRILEQYVLFRKIFEKNLKAGEIVFQNEEDLNIQERPFPNHHNNKKGKWQVKMVSSAEKISKNMS